MVTLWGKLWVCSPRKPGCREVRSTEGHGRAWPEGNRSPGSPQGPAQGPHLQPGGAKNPWRKPGSQVLVGKTKAGREILPFSPLSGSTELRGILYLFQENGLRRWSNFQKPGSTAQPQLTPPPPCLISLCPQSCSRHHVLPVNLGFGGSQANTAGLAVLILILILINN